MSAGDEPLEFMGLPIVLIDSPLWPSDVVAVMSRAQADAMKAAFERWKEEP
jgi:hypothetical protein